MTDHSAGAVLDYAPCHYGVSKLAFRGPKKATSEPYVAFLGGTEFFGKFLKAPVPALVEERLNMPCVNLGCTNAGVDVFAKDPVVLDLASQAQMTVLQITGAHNLSNRFYNVHPRRNDRFVEPTELLRAVFPEVDFTTIHFTRHALQELARVSPTRFRVVVDDLKATWVARMTDLIGEIASPVVLFWMGKHAPEAARPASTRDPLFVDRAMIETLRAKVSGIVECVVSEDAQGEALATMQCSDQDAPAAKHMFGADAHVEAAELLVRTLRQALTHRTEGAAPECA